MRRKTAPSLEDLSAVIGDIHDAGMGGEWLAALQQIRGLLNASGTTVWMQAPSGDFRDVDSLERTTETRDYADYYERLDTLRFAVMRASTGTILTNEMVVPRSEFVRTEFYADYVVRHGLHDCMQVRIFDSPECIGVMAISRTERVGAFEGEDVRLLRLLLPHLRRAMQTRLRLASAGIQHDFALEALDRLSHGVLIVDAQARVVYANSAAEAILRKGDGLAVEATSRKLRGATSGQTSALHRLVAQAADRGGTLAEGESSGVLRLDRLTGTPLLLSTAPVRAEVAWNVSPRPASLLLIGVPEDEAPPAPAHLRALYDLTPAEAAVAGRIALGNGVEATARALRVKPATVRWHLQRVFEKTRTHRQAELARLVERLGVAGGNGHA